MDDDDFELVETSGGSFWTFGRETSQGWWYTHPSYSAETREEVLEYLRQPNLYLGTSSGPYDDYIPVLVERTVDLYVHDDDDLLKCPQCGAPEPPHKDSCDHFK